MNTETEKSAPLTVRDMRELSLSSRVLVTDCWPIEFSIHVVSPLLGRADG